jgi:sulfatase modifying factor 1
MRGVVLPSLALLAFGACKRASSDDRAPARTNEPPGATVESLPTASAIASAAPNPAAIVPGRPEPAAPRRGDPGGACPAGMRLVEGGYCPAPEQICLEWNEVWAEGRLQRNQCKRYREPARCLSPARVPMRYCMDTFEWPNEKGAIPRNLTSWQEAKDTCESLGKRLCTEDEFTFACEGESMRPHVTGFVRDGVACSYDLPYRERTYAYAKHDACLADPVCKAALDALDQRVPAGSKPACVSDDGVYDLNGNVNEWIERPGRGFSKRAGLKGGWWGPVRDRCRPITTFHGESDYGYEVGFRCCKDAGARTR